MHGLRASAISIACLAALFALAGKESRGQFTVQPLDIQGADGVADVVLVETPHYKFRFLLAETGSAESAVYKPLGHEFRAENYYSNHLNLFRDWVRLADPDPIEGRTRNIGDLELREQSRLPARWRVVRQDARELVLEFEVRCSTAGGQPWMDKILNRRRLFLQSDTPAIRVENEIVNTDAAEHSVLFDVYNGVGLGRVQSCLSMPGPDGKHNGIDIAEERASSFVFIPEAADAWIGGVNQQGLGAGFSFDWPDVDAMELSMYKTVGAGHWVVMRRQTVPAGKSITFRYTFLPLVGFGAFDGMNGDLAGGVLAGRQANYLDDVAAAELKPGAELPLKVFLAGGTPREVRVRLRCVRQEDGQAVLDETRPIALRAAETATLSGRLKLGGEGLYVLTVTAEGNGPLLKMEKPLEVGRTKLVYKATPPEGKKRGIRDGGLGLGPASANPQFRTLDLAFATPHLPLAKGHVQGPVRAMFLTPADSTLAHVREICQRSDITPDYFAVTKVRLPKYELHARELGQFREKLRAADPQVLVSLGIHWNVGLKKKLAGELLDRVRDGMGAVVLVRDLEKQPELQEALAGAKEVSAPPISIAAVPVPRVRCFQLGRGRIALLLSEWSESRDACRAMMASWTSLDVAGRPEPVKELQWRGFEHFYAWLADVIRWASGREGPIAISAAALRGETVAVTVRNTAGPIEANLEVRARSRRWEVRATGRASIQVPAGESRHEVQIAHPLDAGPLALEISARTAEGKLLAFASAGAVADAPVTLRVTPEPQCQDAEKPGVCRIEVSGKLPGGELSVDVIDRFGRAVLRRRQPIRLENGQARLDLPLGGFRPLCVYHEIVARLFSGSNGRLLAEASGDVFLIPSKPPYADRFLPGVWGAPERDALHLQGMLDTTHAAGLVLHSHSYDDRVLYWTGGWKSALGEHSAGKRFARPGEAVKLESDKLVMHPPLLPSTEAVEATKSQWQARVRPQFDSGARMIGLDDERRMSDDFDFHPRTLAGFRRWLAGRYPDIAALNRGWGTDFAGFSEVMPRRRKELGDSPNLAPWLEFRRYIGEVLGDYYTKLPAQWAAEISPELSVAEWGIYEPSTAWPVDWRRYAGCYRWTSRYGGNQGVLEDLFRSFAPATRHGEWQGYGMMAIDPGRRIAPWRSLLNGGSFCWFWEMRDSGWLNYAVCTSDLRPTAGYAVLAREEFPDLIGGIDRLILAGRFTDDKIALGYSYPSWLADESALAGRAKVIVEELGVQHTYVDLDDVAAGRLEKEGYRLLVVQQTSCLSTEQLRGIERFARQGGTVLLLGRIGWRDLHGTPHAEGMLADRLTGVDTSKAAPLGRTLQTVFQDRSLWLSVAQKEIVPRDAAVLAAVDLDGGKLPVWTVRPIGLGRVFWVNSNLEGHRAVKTGGVAGERSIALGGPEAVRQSHWDLFDRVIAQAGIQPRCRLHDGKAPVFDTETWYYQSPSGRSLFVAHYLARKIDRPLSVRFDRKRHVYELRSRKYLGETDTIEETFPEGRMKLYALLDYRVTGLQASVDKPQYRPGDEVHLACWLSTDSRPADLHALQVRLLGPEGKELPAYGTVLLSRDGKAQATLPLALNQSPGKHTIVVTDVTSGQTARAVWEVQ